MLDIAGLSELTFFTFVPSALFLQLQIRDSAKHPPPFFVVLLSGLSDFSSGLWPPSKSPGLRASTGVNLLQVNRLPNQFDISRLEIEFLFTKIYPYSYIISVLLEKRALHSSFPLRYASQANQLVIMFMT